ncbi:MAG: CPBP family intramembrane metalloprotease [Prosthecochloris sp.]|nr:CPBP family intramembrane metalloprotease [Prosthecochloris sp.]
MKSAEISNRSDQRFLLSFGLMAAIWITGLVGHFTPLREWPALVLYVLGSIGIVLYRGMRYQEWSDMYLTGGNYWKSIILGCVTGGLLFFMALFNTHNHYSNGGSAMQEMEAILNHPFFYGMFPVLVLAEEFMWRGIMASSLAAKEINRHIVVLVTTLFFALNHFAVAPVGINERFLMAIMALPLGVIGGYISIVTRNLWGSVILHMLSMISMFIGMQLNG